MLLFLEDNLITQGLILTFKYTIFKILIIKSILSISNEIEGLFSLPCKFVFVIIVRTLLESLLKVMKFIVEIIKLHSNQELGTSM